MSEVKPVAWKIKGTRSSDGRIMTEFAWGPIGMADLIHEMRNDGFEVSWEQLYDQSALEAAIAEEVEPYKLFTSNVMKQFLTDVITASGLLSYGKTDKGLAKRLNDRAITVSKAVFDIAAKGDME